MFRNTELIQENLEEVQDKNKTGEKNQGEFKEKTKEKGTEKLTLKIISKKENPMKKYF